jgi:hypothetical protein
MVVFSWSLENVAHISSHQVKRGEAEYVVKHARAPYPEYVGKKKWKVRGQTRAGRYLQVIFTYLEDERVDVDSLDLQDLIAFSDGQAQVVYVIHAMELSEGLKRQTRRREQQL